VIGNTSDSNFEPMNEMVGQELEVKISSYGDNVICVWDKNKSDIYYFNKKDVRFLTPAMFKGNHIAINDEVLIEEVWRKVIGFFTHGSDVRILTRLPDRTVTWEEDSIKDHRTETPETKMTIKQIEEKLNITGLKIIE